MGQKSFTASLVTICNRDSCPQHATAYGPTKLSPDVYRTLERWGPAEMIADGVNGILVGREDVTGLSRAIATLMKDDELRRKLGVAAAWSARKYSHDKILVQWNAVVSSALD